MDNCRNRHNSLTTSTTKYTSEGPGQLHERWLTPAVGVHAHVDIPWGAFCTAHALTRRSEGVLDCIALDDFPQYPVNTLDDMSIQSSNIINSSNGCCVFCYSVNSVHCTREGIDKDLTTLCCPIVYPQRGYSSVTVSTDEGELVWTFPSLELQGDSEGSCETHKTRYVSSAQKSHHITYVGG